MVTSSPVNMLSIWGKKKDEVIEIAISNTYRLFPPRILDICSSYCGLSEEQEFMHAVPKPVNKNRGNGIFITTVNNINGAVSVFMPGVIQRLAELMGSDFYIGFLSMKAAVIHSSGLVSPEIVRDALKFQNDECNSEDFLSEKVYFYSRERD